MRCERMSALNSAVGFSARKKTASSTGCYVLPLHGLPRTLADVAEAIAFIEAFDESKPDVPFTRYEVGVRYGNGDEIRGQFENKMTAIAFLRDMR